MAHYEPKEMANWEHNHRIIAKRVQLAGTDSQTIVDAAITGTTYVGIGARGLAVSDDGWLIMRIVTVTTTTTIQTAIDKWSVRDTTAVYA